MALLNEIIDAASSDTSSVSSLLRKLKVLAARTRTELLAEWVTRELEGYPDIDELPAYRGPFDPPVLAHFMGPFNSELKNAPIAPMNFPEDMRDSPLFKVWMIYPIAELEDLVSQEYVKTPWPADAINHYNWGVQNGKIQPTARSGMVLVGATRTLPRQLFVGVLDAVRNRALDLALELEKVVPEAGEPGATQETRDRAGQVINNYTFHGNNSNIAISSSRVSQTVTLPNSGDEAGLMRYLAAVGVAPQELVQLGEALAEDRAVAGGIDPPSAGARVRLWAGQAATAIGAGAGGDLVFEAIKAYFGG